MLQDNRDASLAHSGGEAPFFLILLVCAYTHPSESEAVNGVCHHVSQERCIRVESREERVHVWGLPMSRLNKQFNRTFISTNIKHKNLHDASGWKNFNS